MEIQISDDLIQERIDQKVEEMLRLYKRDYMSVGIREITEMTSLSRSFLMNYILNEPEVEELKMKIEGRTLYLYPEVRHAFRTVVKRKNLLKNGRVPQWEEA